MTGTLLDITAIRAQFPILRDKVNGAPLVYFDNGATTQKPEAVIDAMSDYYRHSNANIHRGVHTLSRIATELYEDARKTTADFFNVDQQQIIFTAGTTDGINIVAQGLTNHYLKTGDEILLSSYEHHSNILPWQMWAEGNSGHMRVIPLKADHTLDESQIDSLVSARTKLIVIAQVSNTLGVITNIEKILRLAKDRKIAVLIDGAQSAPHMQVDLRKLDPDFFVCSAHKMYGPTGVGVLYMSEKWMKELSSTRSGGGTIKTVSFAKTEYVEGPQRFEPGTPNIAGVVGFAKALQWLTDLDLKHVEEYETSLLRYATDKLKSIDAVEVYAPNAKKAGVISFNVKGQHPFDVGTLLDKYGIALRTGHHCTQPLMQCLGIQGTVRISFAVYNTTEEIDYFIEKLGKVIGMLS